MRVHRAFGLAQAPEATGSVVVIDVLRAFTTAAFALDRGAEEIVLAATPQEAIELRDSDPRAVLVGEVGGPPIPGFHHGNSPEVMEGLDLSGRRVVLRSSSGVQGALAARGADRILLGSLVVAGATARYLRDRNPDDVTLLAMGSSVGPDGPEDVACADHVEALLRGTPADPRTTIEAVVSSPAGRQATDPAVEWITPGDLRLATWIDRFDFAMLAEWRLGRLVARKVST